MHGILLLGRMILESSTMSSNTRVCVPSINGLGFKPVYFGGSPSYSWLNSQPGKRNVLKCIRNVSQTLSVDM